jgi:hypothetical protein
VVNQARSTKRYVVKVRSDEPVLARRLRELVRRRPRFGFRRLAIMLHPTAVQGFYRTAN